MSANSFGRMFQVTSFGESHGPAIGCIIDCCPPGVLLNREQIQAWLTRRRPGQSALVTPRDEKDEYEILSGIDLESGKTLGTPICIMVRNQDQRSGSYSDWHHIYRPSHADFTYDAKYGIRAWQGGGRSSARETIARVAAGAIAEQVLHQRFPKIKICAWVESVHSITAAAYIDPDAMSRYIVDSHITRCPHKDSAELIEEHILEAKKTGNSLGGVVRLYITGCPVGLGDPAFDKLDALLAQAMLSLPACKGFEVGSGFSGSSGLKALSGKENNDSFYWQEDDKQSDKQTGNKQTNTMHTRSNNSGGIQGGISNGAAIDCRIAFKPTATVLCEQDSADNAGNNVSLQAKGRHDPCVLPRAVPIVEAMAALVLCDAFLCQRGQVGDPWPGLEGPLKKQIATEGIRENG